MKLALLLATVDWRLGVLLRGEKGSGKTTAARGLAALLPSPAPFLDLPIGITEDRLLGGLNLERAMQGDPILKPGLLSQAHGGVLYIDEVNLLPAHLGDALLDTAASGVHIVEREGHSATYPAEFVLLGSMNPEEGSLRPQLLDRFALSVNVAAPTDPVERQCILERRIAFERDPARFAADWSAAEAALRTTIIAARKSLAGIHCSPEMLNHISTTVCESEVHSLRADLAVVRAAIACAALEADNAVELHHVATVLPLALAHRTRNKPRPAPPPPASQPKAASNASPGEASRPSSERVFLPRPIEAPAVRLIDPPAAGNGPVVGSQQSERPKELHVRATLTQALRETGSPQPRPQDLQESIRQSTSATRYLFVIDSSGSHAVSERMRLVKGAAENLLTRSFKRGDEVAIIVFRGTAAEAVLEPAGNLVEALTILEYLPTGGRTPLAHGLELAKSYVTPMTILILMTDGRANFPLHNGDPWQEALTVAAGLNCPALVIDTNPPDRPASELNLLADTLRARLTTLEECASISCQSIWVSN